MRFISTSNSAFSQIESPFAPIAARVGPSVDEVAHPLGIDEIPHEALRCPAFALAAAASK